MFPLESLSSFLYEVVFLLMSLYYHLRSYLSILFRVFFVLFLFYFTYSCYISIFSLIIAFIQTISFIQQERLLFCRNLNGCLKKAFCRYTSWFVGDFDLPSHCSVIIPGRTFYAAGNSDKKAGRSQKRMTCLITFYFLL